MKRIVTDLLIAFVLLLACSTPLAAQNAAAQDLPADRFLQGVSAHPAGDEAERDQWLKTGNVLNTASAAEVERVLPAILQYAQSGNEPRLRAFAAGFLLGIAIRPDGADLLSSRSEAIASLIVDADPGIQRVAIAITDYVIGKAGANQHRYVSALGAAIRNPQTPQDVAAQMVFPLVRFDFSVPGTGGAGTLNDPAAMQSALDFLHRNDLTSSTKRDLMHSLGEFFGLPKEVNQYLCTQLDDPDPTVRASALVAFGDATAAYRTITAETDPAFRAAAQAASADSATDYPTLAKDRVEKMAKDPQENPQIRDLAKQALAGQAGLNPNIDIPPDKPAKP